MTRPSPTTTHHHRSGWARVRHTVRPHTHDAADSIDAALESSARGIRAVKISLVALLVTAGAPAGGRGRLRVGRAARRHHPQLLRRADRGPAVDRVRAGPPGRDPALHLRLRPGRGPRRAVRRRDDRPVRGRRRLARPSTGCINPAPDQHLGWVAAAGLIGFVGNEAGRRCTASAWAGASAPPRWSPTGCTPAPTGSPRWPCSSAPAAWPWASAGRPDHRAGHHRGHPRWCCAPPPGTCSADSWTASTPTSSTPPERALADVDGVQSVRRVRMRWIGHQLHADAELDVDPGTSLTDAHAIAHDAEDQLITAVPKLSAALVHAYPAHQQAEQPHHAHP